VVLVVLGWCGKENPPSGALGFGGFADEEAEGAVGGFGDAYAWGG
jgi:hypothetical protein